MNELPDSEGTYPQGSIATYDCFDRYTQDGNSATATCMPDGIWAGLNLTCERG